MKIKGIDISYCQRDIDYKKVKNSGVEFAIIRSGYLQKTDDMLFTHLNGCKKAGIPIGIYVYAMSRTEDEARKEACHCINSISGYELSYPVFYDLEDDRLLTLTSKQRTDNTLAFLDEINEAGYYPAIYANPVWLENYLEKERLNKFDIWLAAWTENPNKETKYDYKQTIWQWGLDSVNGVGIVDGNLCYKDYPSIINNSELGSAIKNNEIVPDSNNAVFKAVNKKYRCLGLAVNCRRTSSNHSSVIGKLVKNRIYKVNAEIYKDGKLKWLAVNGGFSMYFDQVGDILFEEYSGTSFNVGDKVKVKSGSKDYDKKTLVSYVFNTEYIVMEVGVKDNERICIGNGKDITAAVNAVDLIKINRPPLL